MFMSNKENNTPSAHLFRVFLWVSCMTYETLYSNFTNLGFLGIAYPTNRTKGTMCKISPVVQQHHDKTYMNGVALQLYQFASSISYHTCEPTRENGTHFSVNSWTFRNEKEQENKNLTLWQYGHLQQLVQACCLPQV